MLHVSFDAVSIGLVTSSSRNAAPLLLEVPSFEAASIGSVTLTSTGASLSSSGPISSSRYVVLCLRLVVGPHDHLGLDAQQDAHAAGQEEHDRQRGQGGLDERLGLGSSAPPEVGPGEDVLEVEHRQEAEDAQAERPQPEPAEEVQGPLRVALEKADQDQVEHDVEGAAQPVLGPPGGARAMIDDQLGDPPPCQAAKIGMNRCISP